MKIKFFMTLLFMSMLSCEKKTEKAPENKSVVTIDSTYQPFPDHISLVRLIATPEKYDGKYIQVIGYLVMGFERQNLYLHIEDYENGMSENSIWISSFSDDFKASSKSVNKQYVIIAGIFDMNKRGHLGLSGGSIKNISRLESL